MSRLNSHLIVLLGAALPSLISITAMPGWARPASLVQASAPAPTAAAAPSVPPALSESASSPSDTPLINPLVKMTPKMDESYPAARDETLSAQPMSEQDMMKEGVRLTQQQNWDAAAKLFQEVVGMDPKNADAYYNLGAIAENKGDFNDALNWYESAHGLSPNDRSIKDAIVSVEQSQAAMAYGSLSSTPGAPADSMAQENADLAGWKKMMKTEHHRQIRRKVMSALITAAIVALVVVVVCPK
jgi:tetratricopeptide (TPR) repeat protein